MLRKHKRLTKKELKKDPFLIFTAQVVEYLREEWMKIAGTVAVVAVVIIAAFLIVNGRQKGEINAYDRAMTALSNNAPEASELLENLVSRYGGSERAGEALIALGNQSLLTEDYDSAEKQFSTYFKKYTDNPILALNACNGLASIYEHKGDFSKAAETYESFISKNASSVFNPMIHLNAGKAYYHSGDKDAAKRHFTAITEKHSSSREQVEATFFLELLN